MSTVLVVEDSATQATEIKMMLEARSHHVQLAVDGRAALESLARVAPDVVVTDLDMPHMTGLELVEQMQVGYPQVPAILITAQGSEALAVQALRHGAAAYVPKSMMASLLDATIRDVLGVLRADRSYARLIDSLVHNRMTFRLPSEPFLIAPLVDLVVQMIAGMRLLSNNEIVRFSSAFDHALQNGMLHGNLELTRAQVGEFRQSFSQGVEPDFLVQRREQKPYGDRRLDIDVQVTETVIRCHVRDEGPGFDTTIIPSSQSTDSIHCDDGRGLVLLTSFMDEVVYNDRGNEVTLMKHCTRQTNKT